MLILALVAAIVVLGVAWWWLYMSSYSQLFGVFPYKGKTSERVVALTFDDGPNEPFTSEIVDYLAEKHIRATFFQVGVCVQRFPETTKKIDAAGHIIGNHSLSHEFHKYFFQPRFEREVAETQRIITETIGKTPALFRPPWLFRQPFLFATLKKMHLRPVSGEFCAPLEVLQPDGKGIARQAVRKVKPGSIIIFHDGFDGRGGNRMQTVIAVKATVETLMAEGYRFVTIDELLDVPAYQ